MDIFRCLMVIFLYFLIGTRHHASALRTKYANCRSGPYNSTNVIQVGSTLTLLSSGILKTSLSGGYEGNLNCKIVLKPFSLHGIILSIRKLKFRLGCIDGITIKDSDGLLQGYYCSDKDDSLEFTSHYSSGEMTIIFETASGYVSSLYSGFELVYTAYSSSPCRFSEFQCPKGCINKSLKCDGHNHCGDRSDQRNCDTTNDIRWGSASNYRNIKITAIVLGSYFFLMAIVATAKYYQKRRYRRTVGAVMHPSPQQPCGAQYPAAEMYPESLSPQPGPMNYPSPQPGQMNYPSPQPGQMNYPSPQPEQMNYPPPQPGQMNYPSPQYSPNKVQQTG